MCHGQMLLLFMSYLTLCAPWAAACQASLSFTISQSLLRPNLLRLAGN